MTAVAIKELRKEVKHFIDNADERMLRVIYAMLETDQQEDIDDIGDDWWDKISDGERAAIDEGLKQIEEGKTIPHEEAIKQLKWFPK